MQKSDENKRSWAAAAGGLAGLGVCSEYYAIFTAICLLCYCIVHNRKSSGYYILGLAAALMILPTYNYAIFQDPFTTAL